MVPANHSKPAKQIEQNFIRRDIRYLMASFYYYCEDRQSDGIVVLDETDRTDDRRFLQRLERYFSITDQGKRHSRLILPTPLFTESHMSYPVQAADIVCYLISNGFRLADMPRATRPDLKAGWIASLETLKFKCIRTVGSSGPKDHHSIVYVADPWRAKKREGKTLLQNDHKGGFRGRASTDNYSHDSAEKLGVEWRRPNI